MSIKHGAWWVAACAAACAWVPPAQAQEIERAIVHKHVLGSPAALTPEALLPHLRLPPGFRISLFATGLGKPRMMEVAPDGTLLVTRRDVGDVVALRDADGDGVAEQQRTFLSGLPGVHGIDIRQGQVFLASQTTLWRSPLENPRAEVLVKGLPDGGQHANRMLRFGPDGAMYVSVGSSCNDCAEDNQLERATLIRYSADGRQRAVIANGLRNTIGYDWHPATHALWGMDHGSDFRGETLPPEELNLIEPGRNYGWPICYAERQVDEMTLALPERMALRPGEREPIGRPMTREDYCARTEPSRLTLPAHSAPMAMRFYRGGEFPAAYRHGAFVALHGSWNRRVPVGYAVAHVRFDAAGQPMGVEDFVTGFIDARSSAVYGRPAGIAVARDGALLVSDDLNGAIYRIVAAR
jgi:glucose/arabinose dehydrogenase